LWIIVNQANSQGRKPSPEEMLFNSSQGRVFWVAIPPNEIFGYQANALEIYVASAKDCNVTISNPYTGLLKTKKVSAMKITTFSSVDGDLSWNMECRESEEIRSDKVIKIESDQPISVYVLNAKLVTSDGFLGIPQSGWGNEYIHCSYYDFKEIQDWYSGFIIIAGEDNTKVNVELRGRGKGSGKTFLGRDLGDKFQITLNAGQTYMVGGNGKSRGIWDMTGSKITSSKPVGLISFHERTIIPAYDIWNGRDHLSEMLPPVVAWGKKYVTVEYKRDKGMGDYFRIVGSQPNTKISCKYYDKDDGRILGNYEGTLKNAGDFLEFLEVFVPQGAINTIKSVRGTSVWEADKPVLLMQYAYSQDWDNMTEFDPFMIIVVPQEQYIPGTVFQTPASSAFITNWFNIIAEHDSTDLAFSDLKSIKIDGQPISNFAGGSRFTYNQIPTTNLYWAKLAMNPGAHKIVGNGKTKFGGYIYGFSYADSYGWPAAMALNKLDITDTLPPVLTKAGDCGTFYVNATEKRNGKADDNPRQVDQGVRTIELLDGSINYNLTITNPDPFVDYPPVYTADFVLEVKDKSQDAFAVFSVTDNYGNFSIDSVSYEADKISLDPSKIAFGSIRLGTSKLMTAVLSNVGDSIVTIKSIKLEKGKEYKIISGGAPPEFDIPPGGTHNIVIEYTPINESLDPKYEDKDSLLIVTRCDTSNYYIHGRAVFPRIAVEDWNAGSVVVNKKVCKDVQTGTGLKIWNEGTDELIITGIKGVVLPFTTTPSNINFPIKIAAGGDYFLSTPCFSPPATQQYSIDVTFESNAGSGDSVSNWMGRGIEPGPYVTPYDFGKIRVNSDRVGTVYIKNSGNAPVKIAGTKLRFGDKGFSIISTIPTPSVATPLDLQPDTAKSGITEIVVTVKFNPKVEFDAEDFVHPIFDASETGLNSDDVFNFVKGYAYIPKIEVTGYVFDPPILFNTIHPNIGNIVIKSTSTSAPLWVEDIKWNRAQTDFNFVGNPPTKFSIPIGQSVSIPVVFNPKQVGNLAENIDVVNDAHEAPDSIITSTTDVKGIAYSQGISNTDIDFGIITLCDEPVKTFNIANNGSGDITVYDVRLESGDQSVFSIQFNREDIPSMEARDYKVKFNPDRTGNFFATARIYSSVDSIHTVTFKGSVFDMPIQLSMKRYTADDKLAPGYKVWMDVSIKNEKASDAKINYLQAEIVYKSTWMKYDNAINKGAGLDASWTVDAVEQKIDNTTTKLIITMKSATGIMNANNAVIASPRFMILLSDNKDFEPYFGKITTADRDSCVRNSSLPGRIVINTCVADLRGITFSSQKFMLYEIDPNPVTGNNIKISYDVAFKTDTKVDIVDATGSIVKTITNETKGEGRYEEVISSADLNSGIYFVRMVSGPYSEIRKMVISK
jgi:hypothetical protein